MKIALTADLHFGTRHSGGNQATLDLVAHLAENPPDLLILAGDIGAGDQFGRCLALFSELSCLKAAVPGNHDIWVATDDRRGDSLRVYHEHLPAQCREHGFHYLDDGPLLLPESDLAIVGSINWYDYSWGLKQLQEIAPDWGYRLEFKRFLRGMHNDFHYVNWPLTDVSFTTEVVAVIARHLEQALAAVGRAVVVTHHPPFRGLHYPVPEPLGVDDCLWLCFTGNDRLEQVIRSRADRISHAFCGHTHHATDCDWLGIHGHNIGGDYNFKRLLWLDWPEGGVRAVEFGK